jgi:hypothetical protein
MFIIVYVKMVGKILMKEMYTYGLLRGDFTHA